jgi:hypothetical protein
VVFCHGFPDPVLPSAVMSAIRFDRRPRIPTSGTALLLLFLVAFAFASVGAEGNPEVASGEDFGAGLALTRPLPLSAALTEALAAAQSESSKSSNEPVLVQGRIAEVCQRKGCWTILQDGDARVRVRFKDYGFFLPTNCSGRTAYVEGIFEIATLTEAEARHYASESPGGDPSSIHGPQREVGLIATGVRLLEKR